MKEITQSRYLWSMSVGLLASLVTVGCQQRPLERINPKAVLGAIGLHGMWSQSDLVATGSLSQVRLAPEYEPVSYGNPSADHKVCQATFTPRIVFKGIQMPAERLIWLSRAQNCALKELGVVQDVSEYIWFMRYDRDIRSLRPIADNASITLRVPDMAIPQVSDTTTLNSLLARMLLDDRFILGRWDENHHNLAEAYELACELVGDIECRALLSTMQRRAPDSLKAEICKFLAVKADECDIGECGEGMISTEYVESIRIIQNGRVAETKSDLARLESAAANDLEETVGPRVRKLQCHFDETVRRRATALLQRWFPGELAIQCVKCK